MVRRTNKLLYWLFALLVAYLLIVRLVITWAQVAPNQFGSVIEAVTGSEVEFKDLTIEQNWLGVTLYLNDLKVTHPKMALEAGHFGVDVNLFSPLIPNTSWGDFLEVRHLKYLDFSAPEQVPENKPEIELQALRQRLKEISLSRLWRRVDVQDLQVSTYSRGYPLQVYVNTFQAFKGAHWSLASEFEFSYAGVLQNETFQLKASLQPNVWGGIEDGDFSLHSFKPLKIQNLAKLLPHKWLQVLPRGELTLEAKGELSDTWLSNLSLNLYAQALKWPDKQAVLPETFGVNLGWKNQEQLRDESQLNWRFTVREMQIDNHFIQTVSPIELALAKNRNLHFETKQFNIEPFKNMVHSVLRYESVADLFSSAVELSLQNIVGELDIETLEMNTLSMEIDKLAVPVTHLPGLAMEKVYFDKKGEQFQLIADKPIWLMESRVHAIPMRVQLSNRIHGLYKPASNVWQLNPIRMDWDGMPLTLRAVGDFDGYLDANLAIEPGSMAKVKQYLPYSLMSQKLQKWLKTALIDGDSIQGDFFFDGNVNEVSLTDTHGARFGGEVTVKNTQLKFQPNWPALKGFDAKLDFSPYRLHISSDAISLNSGINATAVDVLIDDLNKKDIAVRVKAKAEGQSDFVLDYLLNTPLPSKVSLESFIADKSKLNLSDSLKVDLDEVWIPVSGYAQKTEQVKGRVHLNGNHLLLYNTFAFDQIKGSIEFTEGTVRSDQLQAVFEGGSARFSVDTELKNKQILIKGEGKAQPNYPDIVSGSAGWQAQVSLPMQKSKTDGVQIDVNADMSQANWEMPAPFNDAALKKNINLQLDIKDEQVFVDGEVEGMGKAQILLSDTEERLELLAGNLLWGPSVTQMPKLEPGVFSVQGQVDELDLDAWSAWQKKISENKESTGLFSFDWVNGIRWNNSKLTFNKVNLLGAMYPALELVWQTTEEKRVDIRGQSDFVEFVGSLYDQKKLDVVMNKLALVWQTGDVGDEASGAESSEESSCKLTKTSKIPWPEINFQGSNIHLNKVDVQTVSFNLQENKDVLHFKNLNAQFANKAGQLKGEYFFHKFANQSSTRLELESSNVKSLTKLLGLKQGFSGKKAQMKANLAWTGGPECFKVKALTGRTIFEIKDGVIEDVEPGFARLLGLLNVTSIARRLSLDLKDVTTKGMVYDLIQGRAVLKSGDLQLESFKLQAPSASVGLSGSVDLQNRVFDLNAEVTPALGSSLPALSAITGVASPLGALAIYALMKVIPDINEDLITYRYSVTGPWDKPSIKEKKNNKEAE